MSKKTRLQINTLFVAMLVITFALCGTLLPFIKISFGFLRNLGIVPCSCSPDLILLACVSVSYVAGSKKAALLGLIFGFMHDTLIGVPYNASVIVCCIGAYLAGSLMGRFLRLNFVSGMCCALLPLALRSVCTLFGMLAMGDATFFDILIGCVLCEYLVNILFFIPMYFVVKYIYLLFERLLKWK